MRKVMVTITVIIFVFLGFVILFTQRASIDRELTRVCGNILLKEEFLKTCPSTTKLPSLTFLPLASKTDSGYKCTMAIFGSGRFGIPIVVDVLATKEEAWARLKRESTLGYPQKRGDVLGFKEPSILTDKYGTWWLDFVRDNVLVEMVRENAEMCSDSEFIELGRLLYERIVTLPSR